MYLHDTPLALEVTPDLTRLAMVGGGLLVLYDVPSHKSLGSVHIDFADKGYRDAHLRFVTPDVVQVLVLERPNMREEQWHVRLLSFDAKRRALATLVDTSAHANMVRAMYSADGRTMLVRAMTSPTLADPTAPVQLFDLTTHQPIVTITPAAGEHFSSARLLRDGRIAAVVVAKNQASLRIYSGSTPRSEVNLGVVEGALSPTPSRIVLIQVT